MIHIINTSTNPYFNLALEEYFMKKEDLTQDALILWQNKNTVVIGKNQNAYEELNQEYMKEHGIVHVRRLSGGGAVYHDDGNLNFTIIKQNADKLKNDFSFFSLPVIHSLKEFGIEATFSGRNDILIDGKKFSGNAQYSYKNRLLHHGTLLFDSNLSVLGNALAVKKEKYESKGVKSVQSRVTNIAPYLTSKITIEEFKNSLIKSMFEYMNQPVVHYELTQEDMAGIQQLMEEKYSTFQWNFGQSPKSNYSQEMRFPSGGVSLMMEIENGHMKEVKIFGDFFEGRPVDELADMFKGKPYTINSLDEIFSTLQVSDYIHNLSNEEFRQLFNQ